MIHRARGVLGAVTISTVCIATLAVLPGSATAAVATAGPNTVITFLVGLPNSANELQSAAQAVSTPGNAQFRKYLTVKQAAEKFGATPEAQRALEAAARSVNLEARVDATRLFARVSGTVTAWEKAMGAEVLFEPATAATAQQAASPYDIFGFGSVQTGALAKPPASLAPVVTWFVPQFSQYIAGMDTPGASSPNTSPSTSSPRSLYFPGDDTQPLPTNGGSPLGKSCLPPQLAQGVFTPWQLSHAYGLAGMQQTVEVVQPRIAVISLGGGFSQTDLDYAAKCFGHRAPKVDLRRGVGIDQPIVSLNFETALDLQTVSWAARELSSVRLVQAANNDVGYVEAFSIALTGWPTPPDSITNSWGSCELDEPAAGYFEVNEQVFQFAAVVGTSVLNDAGDNGSSPCQVSGVTSAAFPNPTVQYPASSPFVTGVGGTQLNLGPGNVRIGESVWNDLQYGTVGNAVGGGGPSLLFDAPWYQRPQTASNVRTVPDISAQAGIGPGTSVFFGGELFQPVGGTSQATPLTATGFAMMSARLRHAGKPPLGFLNPWLYRTARFHYESFYDVTVGSNQYPVNYAPGATNVPACCQATPGYDQASGLGAPLFNKLVARVTSG